MDIQRLRLIIDSAPAAEGAAQWSKYTRQVGQDAGAATVHITRMESAIESAGRQFRQMATVAGVGLTAAKVVDYADSWRRLDGQIKLVADSQRDVIRTERDLFDVAQRTRSSYEATASLYVRVAQNAKELGRTHADVMRFTETVQKAIQIGGSGSQEAKAGVIQLGQALGAGVLRGDEFRSVMENMRGVSQTLAQGLGVTVGQLRSMANNGELTAQRVVDAMLKMSDTVDERFKKVPITIGSAFTVADNEIRKYVGETDRGIGASSAFAGAIMLVAKNISLIANAAVVFGAAKLAGAISGLIGPTLQEAKAIATGNAVLLNSREAHLMRAAAAKEAATSTLAASQNAALGLRAELAAITELQMAERRRFAEASTRVRRAVPEAALGPLGGNVAMRDNAAVVLAAKQRAESEALLGSLMQRRLQVQADLAAVETVATAATRANTAANLARAAALNVSTAAMIAATVATRAAAMATGAFNAAMALVGGPIGVAILALMAFVGWLLKKESAEAEAVEQANRHTAAMRDQKTAVEALNRAMAEDITDLNKQQQALDAAGTKGLDRAKKEIAARDLARKYWKQYQEALKDDTSHDATIAKELTLERAMRSSSAVVRDAARQRVENAGLVIGAQARLDAAEQRAKDATEKAKQASEERTRKLKEEATARTKATADIRAETDVVKLNSMAIGESRQVRNAWALVARINTEIHNKHAEAVAGDSEQVAREKAALRDFITTTMLATDALERLTAARNSLRDASEDASVELQQARDMADAWKQGADAVERLKIEQAADNAVRRMTVGLTAAQIATMAEELKAYRDKLVLLGQLNVANQAASTAEKRERQQSVQAAKDAANDVEQMTKNALRGAQRAAAEFFESLMSGGTNSWQKLVDSMRSMFVRLFAELAAMKLGKMLIGAIEAVEAGKRVPLLRGGTNQNGPTGMQQAAVYGTSAFAGFGLGYGIGQASGSQFMAGAGGAVSGAAAGAMIAGPPGAVIGAVAGLVGGLMGHADKIRAERDAMAKARKEFYAELDKFVFGLGEHSPLEKGLKDLQNNFTDLVKKANELGLGYSQLGEAADAVADATARMKQEFLDSIDAQIRNVDGRGYINDALDAQKAYQQNLKDIALAGGDVSKATELFLHQLDKMGDGLTSEQLKDLMQHLPELTKGMDPAAVEALTTALEDDLGRALEATAKAAVIAAEAILRANEDLRVRFERTQGNTSQLLGLDFSQRREMVDAQLAGASPEYLAQLQLVHLYEMSQARIEEQTDAQVKAIQDAATAEQQQLDILAKVAKDELRVQQDALGVAQDNLSATQKVVESLRDYAKSLVVGDLSPLSPQAQYDESRRQFQEAYAKALGGDRDAAQSIPQLANLFLQQSRGFNASTTPYANDFATVQQVLATLTAQYGTQQTAEQQIVDHLQQQVELLQQQIDALQVQSDQVATDAATQIAALQDSARIQQLIRDDVVATIAAQRDAMVARADAEIAALSVVQGQLDAALAATDAQLYELITQRIVAEQNGADNLDGINRQIAELIMVRVQQQEARDKVVEQIAATVAARDMVKTTGDAQIAAINAGASFTDLGFRSLEVMMAAQHAAAVAAQRAEVDRLIAAISGISPVDPTIWDHLPWRRIPPFPTVTDFFNGADGGQEAGASSLDTTMREVVAELRAMRKDAAAAAQQQVATLGQLALDFGEVAQQGRFASREFEV